MVQGVYSMEQKIKNFTDLVAWQEAHRLAVIVYRKTENFPKSEQFGLTNQIRRAVTSIGSNIAEGFSRRTSADKQHFYTIAKGSNNELQSQLLLARDINFLTKDDFSSISQQSNTVSKLLTGLKKSLDERRKEK